MHRFAHKSVVFVALLAGLSTPEALVRAQTEDVEIEVEAAPPSPPPTPSETSRGPTSPPSQGEVAASGPSATQAAAADENAALRTTIERLEARLAALEAERAAVAPDAASADVATGPITTPDAVAAAAEEPAPANDAANTPTAALPAGERPRWWDRLDLRVSGYIQTQLEGHQLSQDELSPDGGPLNQDRFLIRRGRLRVDRYFRYAHVALEIDANTVRGPFLTLRRAEASFFLPNARNDLPPYVMVTAGLSEIPFGFELRQGPRQRVFMERSTGSLAFFPGEPDVGVRVSGAVGPFRYALAVLNGVPIDDRPGGTSVVYNKQKTFVGRFGVDLRDDDRYEVAGGVSFLVGTGFHAGTPATKSELLWRDLNQDGNVTLNELVAVPGQAAVPSETFQRWGVNADLELGYHTKLGWTRVYGELTMASNLDRGYFVADPVSTGYDLREVSWYAAVLQEITPYGLLGFRVDSYDPNSDLFDSRRGLFIPQDANILTLSPIIGGQLPRRGKLLFQYDHVIDHLGRDSRGEPVDLRNDAWTLRLQMEF